MEKVLIVLLLLGAFPLVFFQAQATLCMVCDVFMNGKCVQGKGNCTMEEGGGCRTRDIYFFTSRDGFSYNYTILDCSNPCKAWKLYNEDLKVSSFCCQSRDFCNRYKGKIVNKNIF
ncbi:PREDICTED: acrosomal protein SP-10-like [Chinchilla lanigera]|uniref:acrosomal protein SP-10-like n=1 Tax=Chinchilla lanigera TaxID=34839 RepID=UPI00038ED1D4|nr:PREDICTED: acrosomal protein SP-10-like [Chinchilla lanigera]